MSPPPAPSIESALDDLRRRLLDLTRRNRLLHLPPGARTVLRAVEERPAQLWRVLVEEERALRVLARDDAEPALRARIEAAVADARARDLDVEGELVVVPPPAPPPPPAGADAAPTTLEERHRDRALQTSLDADALDARLLKLERAARVHLEEQGANVLYLTLGAVDWRETPDGPVCRAPLVFVPVTLERTSVTSRHVLRPLDDDVVVNPCLVELMRRTSKTGLPDFAPDEEAFDVVAWLARAREAVETIPGWAYHDEVTVGLYSFSKYLLWRDLDPATWPADAPLVAHPLVRLLVGTPDPTFDVGPGAPAPEALDAVPPTDVLHVVDADASQAAVVAAARAGSSLVVDGPPGTGKSQTIANLIAGCLADGKRVLFVAEKAAALEVVQRRLEAAGLGDFLLELHSRKASKRVVLERLARALERPRVPAAPDGGDPATHLETLRRARDACAAVHAALHTPTGPLARSPYDVIGRAAELGEFGALAAPAERGAPVVDAEIPGAADVDAARLEAARDAAAALDRRRERVPDPAGHPWRGVGVTRADDDLRRRVAEALRALPAVVATARGTGATLARRLGVAVPADAARIAALATTGATLARAAGLDPSTASDPAWDAAGPALDRLAAALRARREARAVWAPAFRPEVETEAWDDVLTRRRAHGHGLLRWLRPSWHRDGARLRRARAAGAAPGDAAARLRALEALVASGRHRAEAEALGAPHAALLGPTWRGIDTDPDVVDARRGAARDAAAAVAAGLASAEAVRALAPPEARAALDAEATAATRAVEALDRWAGAWVGTLATSEAAWFGGAGRAAPLDALEARHAALASQLDALDDAAAYVEATRRCEATGLASFVTWSETDAGAAARGGFADGVERLLLRRVAEARLAETAALATFRGEDHAAVVERFRSADRASLLANRVRVVERLLARRPDVAAGGNRATKLGLLRAQMRLKRGHLPVRRLLERAGDVVQAVTPCFLMSPLSVAHHLAPGAVTFDVVVFDEASQVEPADALGAVARARQVVLFGDERQLPPTSFFARLEGGDDDLVEPEDDAGAGRLESVLSLALARLPGRNRAPLRWHYRSRDPSLVEFSNRHFYEGGLVTFPAPFAARREAGVFLRPVAPGGYRRGAGQFDPVEARAVAEAVLAHARAVVRAGTGPSLGVGAMSVAQQRAIEDEVERLRREDPTKAAEPFFATDRDEPFFVKNLETIQGDERDVVFVSVGYGADATGRLTMNFGPLNAAHGWRRLNVLVTRARTRVEVFSTLRAADLRTTEASPRGVLALQAYLAYAERGVADEDAQRGARIHPGGVEAALARALAARGHVVHASVGDGPGALDLAVVHPTRPDVYALGIEGDGAAYRAGATVRDRDRLRPEVLARMGWRLERVGSVDWLRRPKAVVERVAARIEAAVRAADAAHVATPIPPTPPPSAAGATPSKDAPRPAAAAALPPPLPDAVPGAPAVPTGFVPYPARDATPWGTVDDLVEARPARLAAWIASVVTREGPIHVDEALRVLATSFGTRVTPRPREAFDRGLAGLLGRGDCVRRGDFLWPAGLASPAVRWRGGDCPVVDPDLVAPEEFEGAVRATLAAEFGAPREGLVAATVRRLGFVRGGPRLKAAVDAAVHRLLAAGDVAPDAHGDLVVRRP